MDNPEIISLVASIASLILAFFAIWLSFKFFKISLELSESTKEASKDIKASVNKLENLFDKLYEGTFSMVKDTYTDMREHAWSGYDIEKEKIEKEASRKTEALREEMEQKISEILRKQEKRDVKDNKLRALVNEAIGTSRAIESEKEFSLLMGNVIDTIENINRTGHVKPTVNLTYSYLKYYLGYTGDSDDYIYVLKEMEERGYISIDKIKKGEELMIRPSSTIRLKNIPLDRF